MMQLTESGAKAGSIKRQAGDAGRWFVDFLRRTVGGVRGLLEGNGLYVHSSVLSYFECRQTPKGLQSGASIRVDLPISYQGSLLSTQLAPPLLELFARIPASSRKARICFSGEDSFLRYFEMPLVTGKDQEGAIRFEMRKHSPFPMGEIYCGHHAVADKNGKLIRVVFGGVKREMADHVFAEAKKAGVQCVGAEPAYASLWRLYLHHQPKEKKRKGSAEPAVDKISMLVDIDDKGSVHTLIVRKGLPVLARHALVRPLGLGLGVEPEQVLPEIRLSYDYFARSFKGEKIDRVVLLSGRGFDALPQLIEKELSLACQKLSWGTERAAPPAAEAARSAALDSRACGAGIGSIPINRIARIDLTEKRGMLPWQAPQMPAQEEKKFITEWVAREALVVVGVVGLISLLVAAKVFGLERSLASAQKTNQAAHAEFAAKPLVDLRSLETERVAQSGDLRRLFGAAPVSRKMDAVAATLPEGFWLESFEYAKGGGFSLHGNFVEANLPEGVVRVQKWKEALLADKDFMTGLKGLSVEYVRNEERYSETENRIGFRLKAKVD